MPGFSSCASLAAATVTSVWPVPEHPLQLHVYCCPESCLRQVLRMLSCLPEAQADASTIQVRNQHLAFHHLHLLNNSLQGHGRGMTALSIQWASHKCLMSPAAFLGLHGAATLQQALARWKSRDCLSLWMCLLLFALVFATALIAVPGGRQHTPVLNCRLQDKLLKAQVVYSAGWLAGQH